MDNKITFENINQHDLKLIKSQATQEYKDGNMSPPDCLVKALLAYINAMGCTIVEDPDKVKTWSSLSKHWHSEYMARNTRW